jgi:hypothetical protein
MFPILDRTITFPTAVHWAIFEAINHPFVGQAPDNWTADAMVCDIAAAILILSTDPVIILKHLADDTFADHVITLAADIRFDDAVTICRQLRLAVAFAEQDQRLSLEA